MPKASPSKAPLPKKPREPKKVKDVALNTMRVADYQAKLAVYEEEMAAYKVGQRERKVDKRSAQRRLSAGDAEPAAKRPTPVPSSCLLPRASPLAHTPPNPAPPCAHPRHRRTCPPNQARRETPEACAAGSAEAPRAPPAEPLRRLPQVLREEKEAAAAVEPEARGDGVELPAGASKRQRALYAIKMNMAAASEREAEATKAEAAVLAPSHAAPPRRRPPRPRAPPTPPHTQARRPTRRQLAAAVAGGWSKYKDSLPFWSPNPTRRAQQEAWFEEVATLAEQAGVDGMLYPWGGEWCDDDASDYDEEYLPCHREDVLFDLDSNGRRPTAAELAPLAWPHSCWWHDRDRIVLLYMHMLDNPPDGSFLWEARVCEQVHALWSDGRDSRRTSISYVRQGRLEGARPASTRAEAEAMREEGMRMAFSDGALPGGEDIPGAAFVVGRAVTAPRRLMTHQCFEDEAAPGWRMLSSLPSCPNPHMRFPMSSSLREIVSRGGEPLKPLLPRTACKCGQRIGERRGEAYDADDSESDSEERREEIPVEPRACILCLSEDWGS